VNGEEAADRGADELGIVTTCVPDGEGKWRGEYTKSIVGKVVRSRTASRRRRTTLPLQTRPFAFWAWSWECSAKKWTRS
jgi:hypothetical protein